MKNRNHHTGDYLLILSLLIVFIVVACGSMHHDIKEAKSKLIQDRKDLVNYCAGGTVDSESYRILTERIWLDSMRVVGYKQIRNSK